jgi:hypothetical protein
MIERRIFYIHTKRIKVADIKLLAKMMDDECHNLQLLHDEKVKSGELTKYVSAPAATFVIVTKDNIEYEGPLDDIQNIDIFTNKAIIEATLSIRYRISDIQVNAHFADDLNVNKHSYIQVEGTDRMWIGGMFNKLQEAVSSFEDQVSVFKKYKWPISIMVGILGGYGLGWLFSLLLPLTSNARQAVFITVSSMSLIAIIPIFENYLSKLWPDIEIIPFLEHERILDRRRKYLFFVISVILIPLAISVVTQFINPK